MEQDIEWLLDIEELVEEFKKRVVGFFFSNSNGKLKEGIDDLHSYYCYTPLYRQEFDTIKGIVNISDLLGIRYLEICKGYLEDQISNLEDPFKITKREVFEKYLNKIKKVFSEEKNEIKEKLSLLNPEEMDRLNEAIHCFFEGCYCSAVAMSVCAIESRLLNLMTVAHPDPELEEMTLGQLISEYLGNKEKYNNIIPKKHEPLLDLCNTYRIFSVHPKREKITKPIATSVLNLSLAFLLDQKLIKKEKALEK